MQTNNHHITFSFPANYKSEKIFFVSRRKTNWIESCKNLWDLFKNFWTFFKKLLLITLSYAAIITINVYLTSHERIQAVNSSPNE